MNILLALRQRDLTGAGCKLDVSMADNLFTFMYASLAEGELTGRWPGGGEGLTTGGSPRYQVYRTSDGRFVAAAPLEDRFWQQFCAAIELADAYRDDARDPAATRRAVAERIAARTAEAWREAFAGRDVCAVVVSTLAEATADPHFRGHGLFNRRVATDRGTLTALPVPIADDFRDSATTIGYPRLGEGNALLEGA
jgi:crotonobetainyl-CoA:carnitine CoA-transferase CaiB-like acyl-CoA transferase